MESEQTINRLRELCAVIPSLYSKSDDDPDFIKWQTETRMLLERTFGAASNEYNDFRSIRYYPDFELVETHPKNSPHVKRGLDHAKAFLESLIQISSESGIATAKPGLRKAAQLQSNKVFLVHGRDEGAKEKVKAFLSLLGLKPIILADRPNAGRTIFRKLLEESDVGFAVVLLTPDDCGKLDLPTEKLQLRARQNVIFELGYFFGHLGPERVCALYDKRVERPSDFDGVGYVEYNAEDEGWKVRLGKELRAAGYSIDLNQLFEA